MGAGQIAFSHQVKVDATRGFTAFPDCPNHEGSSTFGIPCHEHSVTTGHEVLVCANLEHGLSITHQFLKFLNPQGLVLSTNIRFEVQFLEQAFKARSQKTKCQKDQ